MDDETTTAKEVFDLTQSGRIRQALGNGYIPGDVTQYIIDAIGMKLESEKPAKPGKKAQVGELRKRIGKLDDHKARIALYHLVEQTFKGKITTELLDEAIKSGEGFHH